ncbi:MAG: zinc-dependent peptidase [Imperialibacter sp.]|uniref:zinc-dependent peptidase n=1 Tax=Imperialibacter sp. TaxID=2038411 RepID=UPI0032F08278
MAYFLSAGVVFAFLWVVVRRSARLESYWRWMRWESSSLTADRVRPHIEKHFDYYRRLPPVYKIEFENKLIEFIDRKDFTPRQMQSVTEEMKVLISAAATQLTFGLPDIYLENFSRILVYPDDYYSTIFKRYHRGEVNLGGGIIVLSWKGFVSGYADGTDGLNLGLHEMAHALKLENGIFNEEYNFFDEGVLQEWTTIARNTIAEIREGTETFFRSYGGVSIDEFFAVAIENFFERPIDFQLEHPRLYKFTVLLLRQDPIRLLSLAQ